jgi:hypothetical protein
MKMTYKKFYKYYKRWQETDKMLRKFKKHMLGTKISRAKLRKMKESIKFIPSENECSEAPQILPYEFCPKCGCQAPRHVDYEAPYPDVYYADFCLRCGEEVGGADNSRYHHVLEEMYRGVDG